MKACEFDVRLLSLWPSRHDVRPRRSVNRSLAETTMTATTGLATPRVSACVESFVIRRQCCCELDCMSR